MNLRNDDNDDGDDGDVDDVDVNLLLIFVLYDANSRWRW